MKTIIGPALGGPVGAGNVFLTPQRLQRNLNLLTCIQILGLVIK